MKKVPLFEANKIPEGEEFEKFFKGSKVVSKSGKPLLMYHGGSYSTGEFKGGWFTSSSYDAKHYAKKNDGVVTKAYLSIKNPLYAGRVDGGDFIEANAAVVLARKTKGKDGMIDILDASTGTMDAVPNNSNQIWIVK